MESKLPRRFFLFAIGFAISSVFVYFFMYKNRDLPAFWPSGKVKEKIIQSKRISEADSCYYKCLNWNEVELKAAIETGGVNFNKSKPRKTPCSEYRIDVIHPKLNEIMLNIQSCDSTFALLAVTDIKDFSKSHCNCP